MSTLLSAVVALAVATGAVGATRPAAAFTLAVAHPDQFPGPSAPGPTNPNGP